MQTLFIATAFCMLVSYALCGIPFGVIVGRLFCGEDVRQKGSGNIGMTNVARVAGKKAAALTFLCDVGKAVCAMRRIYPLFGKPLARSVRSFGHTY